MLFQAEATTADALAAVTSGDNINILCARIARDHYNIKNVVARIYDPARAEIYMKLGIPTVATSLWTTQQVKRWMLPVDDVVEWTDTAGTMHLVERIVPDALAGKPGIQPSTRRRASASSDWFAAVRVGSTSRASSPKRTTSSSSSSRHEGLRRLHDLLEASATMKVVIAGGGSVGTSIALDLDRPPPRRHAHGTGHRDAPNELKAMLPGVTVLAADACEYASLAAADVRSADVMIAATGDDEDNLVISWLSKQEFGVPRVISRINNARNEWLFNESWGVDVSVSTPALITSLVDEAVEVGAIIELMTLAHGRCDCIEVTLGRQRHPPSPKTSRWTSCAYPTRCASWRSCATSSRCMPCPTMHFLEQDHVVLIARVDATQDCTRAFVG